jgi:hypothetical protein
LLALALFSNRRPREVHHPAPGSHRQLNYKETGLAHKENSVDPFAQGRPARSTRFAKRTGRVGDP